MPSSMPSFFTALLVSTSATGMPLITNTTSARFRYLPFVYCHSSFTWQAFAAQPGQHFGIALDVVADAFDARDDLVDVRDGHHAGIQADELVAQRLVEERSAFAAPERERLVRGDIGPADLLDVFDQRVLDRSPLTRDARHG